MARRLIVVWVVSVGLSAVLGCGDDDGVTVDAGTDAAQDAVADVGTDAGEDVTADAGDVGWIDGTYLDGRESPPIENCTDGDDNDGDGQADCIDEDCSSRLVCAGPQTAEIEPNGESEQGQMLILPALVAGTIGEYTEDGEGVSQEDVDWYRFTIEAPTLIVWEFDDVNGPAIPLLTLVGLEDATGGVGRQLDSDTPGRIRQAYLPVAGQYGVEVRDRRNTRMDDDEFPYGGELFDYVFRIAAVPLEASSATLPLDTGPAQFGEDNSLPIYELSLSQGQVFEGELWAERLAPSSALNAMLYLVNRADGGILGFDDNAPLNTIDPLLRTGILAESYDAWLIVDAWRVDFSSDHELFAGHFQPALDREPNNPIGLAYPAEAGTPISGEIEAPFLRFRNTITDADYYYFPGGFSASYLVEVTPEGGDFDASVRTGWRAYSRGVAYLAEIFLADPPDGRAVRLEAISLVNQPFFVEVADRRNVLVEDAEPVGGGAGFEYELNVTSFARTLEPLALPAAESGELTLPGQAAWYEVTVPARTRLEVSATELVEGFEPFLYLSYQNDAFTLRTSREFYLLNAIEQTMRLGVIDRRAGGGDSFDYDLTVEAQTYAVLEEQEPNDGPPEGGQLLPVLPVWVDATLTGTNDQSFDTDSFVINVEAGDHIVVETFGGIDPESPDADTRLRLEGPGLTDPVEDDNDGFGWFSRITDLEIPTTGAYEIFVTPWCNRNGCRVGDYALAVWVL